MSLQRNTPVRQQQCKFKKPAPVGCSSVSYIDIKRSCFLHFQEVLSKRFHFEKKCKPEKQERWRKATPLLPPYDSLIHLPNLQITSVRGGRKIPPTMLLFQVEHLNCWCCFVSASPPPCIFLILSYHRKSKQMPRDGRRWRVDRVIYCSKQPVGRPEMKKQGNQNQGVTLN